MKGKGLMALFSNLGGQTIVFKSLPAIDTSKVRHGLPDWSKYFGRRMRQLIGKICRKGFSPEEALKILSYRKKSRDFYSDPEIMKLLQIAEKKGHEIYRENDFTDDEILRDNLIAKAVLSGLMICKQCGEDGANLFENYCR